jgi:hypothetical protein
MRWAVRKHPTVIAYVIRVDAPPELNAALARLFDANSLPADDDSTGLVPIGE